MIDKINQALENMGNKFRTNDGYTIIMYIGKLTFLRKTFDTQEECFAYVNR